MCGACADPYLRATAPLPLALLAPDAVVARALGQFAARARSRHRPRQRSRIDRVHVGRFAVSCKAQIVYRLRATGGQSVYTYSTAPRRRTRASRRQTKSSSSGCCESDAGTRPCPFWHLERWPTEFMDVLGGYVGMRGSGPKRCVTVRMRWLRRQRRRCSALVSKNCWQMSACGWATPCASSRPTVCHEYVLRPLAKYEQEEGKC